MEWNCRSLSLLWEQAESALRTKNPSQAYSFRFYNRTVRSPASPAYHPRYSHRWLLCKCHSAVDSQILLSLFVKRCYQQSRIAVIYFILGSVIVSLQWQFQILQTVARIYHTGIGQPFQSARIFPITGTGCNLSYLEFLILLGQNVDILSVEVQYLRLSSPSLAYLVISSS